MTSMKSTVAKAKDAALRWSLEDAAAVFPALSELAERHGYRAALMGSVLTRGIGRDLDVAMFRLKGADHHRAAFISEFGGQVIRDLQTPGGADHAHVLKGERVYDFSFGILWAPRLIENWRAIDALREAGEE